MKKRAPENLCLLCQKRKATKKNSHIFPKFWVRSIFGPDNQKEGYTVTSTADKLGQKIQDSPKEDYILCPECEARLSVIERYIANTFYNPFKNPLALADFPITQVEGDELDTMLAIKVNPIIFKLFIYSMLWRASLSNHPVFFGFKLKAEHEKRLRRILDDYLQDTEVQIAAYFNEHESDFKSLPFNIITTLSSSDATSNMIAPFNAEDGRILLFANEFMIIVYLDWEAANQGGAAFNLGKQNLCISVVPLDRWQEFHTSMITMFVGSRQRNLGSNSK